MPKSKLPTTMNEPRETKTNEAEERKWRAEDALRDIERAEKHRKNRELMKDVKILAREKIKTMKDIC